MLLRGITIHFNFTLYLSAQLQFNLRARLLRAYMERYRITYTHADTHIDTFNRHLYANHSKSHSSGPPYTHVCHLSCSPSSQIIINSPSLISPCSSLIPPETISTVFQGAARGAYIDVYNTNWVVVPVDTATLLHMNMKRAISP